MFELWNGVPARRDQDETETNSFFFFFSPVLFFFQVENSRTTRVLCASERRETHGWSTRAADTLGSVCARVVLVIIITL